MSESVIQHPPCLQLSSRVLLFNAFDGQVFSYNFFRVIYFSISLGCRVLDYQANYSIFRPFLIPFVT